MAAPQALRSGYADLVGSAQLPVLQEIFDFEFAQHPRIREMLFKVVNTNTSIWQSTEIHEMPTFSSVSEGADYTFDRPKQGYDSTLTVLKYGLGFSITEEMVDDGKYDLIASATRFLARAAAESQETAAMNILNNAFGSTVTGDGLALCHTAHTTPTGSVTFSNRAASNSDLSITSLEQGLIDFSSNFKGDRGVYHHIRPKFLVVSESDRLTAEKLVGSDKMPGGPDNDLNAVKSRGLQVVSSPLLTDTDAWFLSADPAETGLRIVQRKPLETKASGPDHGFLNDAMYFKARYREIVGVTHPYGVYGTPGA